MDPTSLTGENAEIVTKGDQSPSYDYEALLNGTLNTICYSTNNNGNLHNNSNIFAPTKTNDSNSERDSSDEFFEEEESVYRRKKKCIDPGTDSPFNV